nr:hypothetical protein [Synergistaceae bacterium]
MKRLLAILLSTALILTAPGAAWARPHGCHDDGEELEDSSEAKPDWVDRTHFEDSQYEYFVGLATQSTKLETARRTATDNGVKLVIESLGLLSQARYQEVSQLDVANLRVHDMLGVIGFPAFIRNKKDVSWYHEKWVSYSNCRPAYSYNAWVLLRIPKAELAAEREKASAYLERAQALESAKAPPELMPDASITRDDIPLPRS